MYWTFGSKTNQFIRLAERVSGEDLDELFDTWLFTPGKPDVATAIASRSAALPEMDAQRRVAARWALR